MKGKLVFISLAILTQFVLYFGTSSHTWDLVHKLELNLLVVFILFLCFAPTVQSGNDIQEFKTLRYFRDILKQTFKWIFFQN